MRRRIVLAATVTVLACYSAPARADNHYDYTAPRSRVLNPGPYAPLPFEVNVLASAIDGEDIEVGVWRPDVPDGTRVPILLIASPYHGSLEPSMDGYHPDLGYMLGNFLPHGYAIAGVAVRGTGGSGGCIDIFGPNETADLDQAVRWLASRPWTTGAVGVIGSSYDGSTAWEIASTGNPAVRTIVPMNSIPAVGDLMFRDGTAHSVNGPVITSAYYGAHSARVTRDTDDDPVATTADRRGDAVACPDPKIGLAASLYSTLTGAHDPFGYFAARDHRAAIADKYRGSVLMVAGFEDWNVPTHVVVPFTQSLANRGLPVWQVLHQGDHYPPDWAYNGGVHVRWDWAEYLLGWFDTWLKDDTGVDLGPHVQVQDTAGRWRYADAFPAGSPLTTTTLTGSDVLLTPRGFAGNRFTGLPAAATGGGEGSDVENLPPLPGTASEHRLAGPLHISGVPELAAAVTPLVPGTHLGAWLYDVSPDGTERRIGWAQMNLDFAAGDGVWRPATPGERVVARMRFEPTDAFVADGHQLLLRVWQFSSQENNPGLVPAPLTLHVADSVLRLPAVTPAASDFFEPPRPPL